LDFFFDHNSLVGPDGEAEVAHILHRLEKEEKTWVDPD